ncbi:fumarylacetoacetate hydrolase family protein [Solwaraspora sp. WMMD1047]|uniref:2-keto-4-pentenoate hydratase n=1 Tax=Solwaraspora sp. WMMD1047 TaxID=3016102 RepID=UPI002417E717|nr:fumarylacetoacetate hydrolase family protein [Solwaraspora sp. WMMD1047]MDG4830574.1 fumarylacetoacetate hydrolase family protein [Solwaraspora sp. WMMD1047]
MRTDLTARAVTALAGAAATGAPCEPVRTLIGETDLDAAYAVQSALIDDRVAAGARIVGRKIGLTSPAVQRQFGVYQPDFGTLLDDMVHSHAQPVPLPAFLQPRVEAEVAFVLGTDITVEQPSVADVLRATDFVLAAIEIVDSRIRDWDIRITDTVADNASSGAVVLGTTPYPLAGLDLAEIGMVLEVDGEPASTGAGSACLGSPVTAVVWLARELSRRGTPLRAGEIVLSGALGPMVPVTAPGRYRAHLAGLGSVEAIIAGETP